MSETTTLPDLDIDQNTLDELGARADLAEREHDREQARKHAHLYVWISGDTSLPSHTLCGRWLTFGRKAHMSDVKCPTCVRIHLERTFPTSNNA